MNISSSGQADSVGPERRAAALRSALTPILPFLEDAAVIEVMLNADGTIWVEKARVGVIAPGVRMSPSAAERMLRLVAAEMQLELNADHPSLAAKLPIWGARLQATIRPVVSAPIFAMRKPASIVLPLQSYVESEVLTLAQREALERCVLERQNILIGGGTGSGKTTFANALLDVIANGEDRVLIIEDTSELQCRSVNRVELLVQPPAYSWQRAVMDAMRLRPDRIIVGEVRDGSALELLKAWNTGHPGGVATVHANDTRAMLDRMCQLIEEVVHPAPRALVAQTVNVCVHIRRDKRHPSGRSISAIDRVDGLDELGRWRLSPLL